MKFDKYIILLPSVNKYAAKRTQVRRPLTRIEFFILLYCKKWISASAAAIFRYALKYGCINHRTSLLRSIQFLESQNMLIREGRNYSISYLGREYLASMNRGLKNKRIKYL